MKQFSKWWLAVGALVSMLLCQPVSAQPPVTPANRVLFVVETSWAMRQQLPAARTCVRELLGSGLQGQLRAGDTIGLWTYDSELHAGVFPMQVWADDQRGKILETTGDFLNRQKAAGAGAAGAGRLDLALPEVLRLIGESEAITVLLISDGRATMRGTPFDDSINEVWRGHQKEMQAARVPFVTVLVARAGKIVTCNVNPATAVSVPVLPQAVAAKPAPVTVPVPPAPAPLPVKTNPPLIVDYSKSNLTAAVNQTSNVSAAPQPKLEVVPSSLTNAASAPPVVPVGGVIESSAPPLLTTSAPAVATLETKATAPAEAKHGDEIIAPPIVAPLPTASPTSVPRIPSIPAKPSQAALSSPKAGSAPEQGRSRGMVFFIGGAVLGLVVVWWLIAGRRATSRRGGSLITKSFDRGNKR